jgi:membrane-associated phospholipid phosphatase
VPAVSLSDLDRTLLRTLRERGHTRAVERVTAAYSRLGEHGACWVALGFAGAWMDRSDPTRRRGWLQGARAVVFAYGLNYTIKLLVRRRRPELPGLPPLTGVVSSLSLPSAHATTSFAAARAYAGLAPGWVLYAAAVALALSRPYLGVHYPSDVLVGAAVGTAVGEAFRR